MSDQQQCMQASRQQQMWACAELQADEAGPERPATWLTGGVVGAQGLDLGQRHRLAVQLAAGLHGSMRGMGRGTVTTMQQR